MLQQRRKNIFINWLNCLYDSRNQAKSIEGLQWKGQNGLSIFDLLIQLSLIFHFEDSIIISGLTLMKKVHEKGLAVNSNTVYKLTVVCLYIAHKFYADFHYSLEDFSIASGVRIKNIKDLEPKVLEILNYQLMISESDYEEVFRLNSF